MNPKDLAGALKPPLGLVPASANIIESLVLSHGAEKYDPFNWRSIPVGHMAYLHAAMRHIAAYIDGEDNDPESGLPHLAHARASLGILLDAICCGSAKDDRPKAGAAATLIAQHTKVPDVKDDEPVRKLGTVG